MVRYPAISFLKLIDTRHRILKIAELFEGTIGGAAVHLRAVVRKALGNNSAAVELQPEFSLIFVGVLLTIGFHPGSHDPRCIWLLIACKR